jgi:hypothetical protein
MSDYMKIIIVVASLALVGVMRYYFSSYSVEPQIEKIIEEVVELETGIDILPKMI